MFCSSDGKTRDLVSSIPGAGWDFSINRHPYHEIERPFGPHYCVYNRRLMACCFDKLSTEEGYWNLRTKAAVLNTGEFPLQFEGPDAQTLLNRLFTKDIAKLKPMRCGYGIACYEDGTLLVDGILLRLSQDKFWYAQADGDFYSWARAHATGLDVSITDPQVYVSQVQGPTSLDILADAAEGGLPETFTYFGIAKVNLGGQHVIITRTGYTNELGWEFYTEPHQDAHALWAHIKSAGEPHGISLFGLDSMHIRRIEAGILNAGSDFDNTTTPFDVGLGMFVDLDKDDFIGKSALVGASKDSRLSGVVCEAEPHIGGHIFLHDADQERPDSEKAIGFVTAGAVSPALKTGIGIARLNNSQFAVGSNVLIECIDGQCHKGELVSLPMYDAAGEIPRGKLVDIPARS